MIPVANKEDMAIWLDEKRYKGNQNNLKINHFFLHKCFERVLINIEYAIRMWNLSRRTSFERGGVKKNN